MYTVHHSVENIKINCVGAFFKSCSSTNLKLLGHHHQNIDVSNQYYVIKYLNSFGAHFITQH